MIRQHGADSISILRPREASIDTVIDRQERWRQNEGYGTRATDASRPDFRYYMPVIHGQTKLVFRNP